MARAKVRVKTTTTVRRIKKTGGKRGNPNKCPTCGKFMGKK